MIRSTSGEGNHREETWVPNMYRNLKSPTRSELVFITLPLWEKACAQQWDIYKLVISIFDVSH